MFAIAYQDFGGRPGSLLLLDGLQRAECARHAQDNERETRTEAQGRPSCVAAFSRSFIRLQAVADPSSASAPGAQAPAPTPGTAVAHHPPSSGGPTPAPVDVAVPALLFGDLFMPCFKSPTHEVMSSANGSVTPSYNPALPVQGLPSLCVRKERAEAICEVVEEGLSHATKVGVIDSSRSHNGGFPTFRFPWQNSSGSQGAKSEAGMSGELADSAPKAALSVTVRRIPLFLALKLLQPPHPGAGPRRWPPFQLLTETADAQAVEDACKLQSFVVDLHDLSDTRMPLEMFESSEEEDDGNSEEEEAAEQLQGTDGSGTNLISFGEAKQVVRERRELNEVGKVSEASPVGTNRLTVFRVPGLSIMLRTNMGLVSFQPAFLSCYHLHRTLAAATQLYRKGWLMQRKAAREHWRRGVETTAVKLAGNAWLVNQINRQDAANSEAESEDDGEAWGMPAEAAELMEELGEKSGGVTLTAPSGDDFGSHVSSLAVGAISLASRSAVIVLDALDAAVAASPFGNWAMGIPNYISIKADYLDDHIAALQEYNQQRLGVDSPALSSSTAEGGSRPVAMAAVSSPSSPGESANGAGSGTSQHAENYARKKVAQLLAQQLNIPDFEPDSLCEGQEENGCITPINLRVESMYGPGALHGERGEAGLPHLDQDSGREYRHWKNPLEMREPLEWREEDSTQMESQTGCNSVMCAPRVLEEAACCESGRDDAAREERLIRQAYDSARRSAACHAANVCTDAAGSSITKTADSSQGPCNRSLDHEMVHARAVTAMHDAMKLLGNGSTDSSVCCSRVVPASGPCGTAVHGPGGLDGSQPSTCSTIQQYSGTSMDSSQRSTCSTIQQYSTTSCTAPSPSPPPSNTQGMRRLNAGCCCSSLPCEQESLKSHQVYGMSDDGDSAARARVQSRTAGSGMHAGSAHQPDSPQDMTRKSSLSSSADDGKTSLGRGPLPVVSPETRSHAGQPGPVFSSLFPPLLPVCQLFLKSDTAAAGDAQHSTVGNGHAVGAPSALLSPPIGKKDFGPHYGQRSAQPSGPRQESSHSLESMGQHNERSGQTGADEKQHAGHRWWQWPFWRHNPHHAGSTRSSTHRSTRSSTHSTTDAAGGTTNTAAAMIGNSNRSSNTQADPLNASSGSVPSEPAASPAPAPPPSTTDAAPSSPSQPSGQDPAQKSQSSQYPSTAESTAQQGKHLLNIAPLGFPIESHRAASSLQGRSTSGTDPLPHQAQHTPLPTRTPSPSPGGDDVAPNSTAREDQQEGGGSCCNKLPRAGEGEGNHSRSSCNSSSSSSGAGGRQEGAVVHLDQGGGDNSRGTGSGTGSSTQGSTGSSTGGASDDPIASSSGGNNGRDPGGQSDDGNSRRDGLTGHVSAQGGSASQKRANKSVPVAPRLQLECVEGVRSLLKFAWMLVWDLESEGSHASQIMQRMYQDPVVSKGFASVLSTLGERIELHMRVGITSTGYPLPPGLYSAISTGATTFPGDQAPPDTSSAFDATSPSTTSSPASVLQYLQPHLQQAVPHEVDIGILLDKKVVFAERGDTADEMEWSGRVAECGKTPARGLLLIGDLSLDSVTAAKTFTVVSEPRFADLAEMGLYGIKVLCLDSEENP